MNPTITFWHTFLGMVVRPRSTLRDLEEDSRAVVKGALAFLLVLAIYTAILAIFIARKYPAVAPSALPISVEDQYRYQIWYQGPVFLVATLVTAGLLVLFSRIRGREERLGIAFARVSFATSVPFAFTTMLVELAVSLLVLVGVLQPSHVIGWLTGGGAWFATTYQLAGLIWILALLAITVKVSVRATWWLSTALGLVLLIVYGLPIAFLIR